MKLSTRLPGLPVQFDSDSCPYLSPIANMKTISFWTISFNDISNWPCIIENIHVLSTKDGPCGLCCVAATSLSCEIRSFFVWQGGGPASPPPTPIYIQIEIQIEFFFLQQAMEPSSTVPYCRKQNKKICRNETLRNPQNQLCPKISKSQPIFCGESSIWQKENVPNSNQPRFTSSDDNQVHIICISPKKDFAPNPMFQACHRSGDAGEGNPK